MGTGNGAAVCLGGFEIRAVSLSLSPVPCFYVDGVTGGGGEWETAGWCSGVVRPALRRRDA